VTTAKEMLDSYASGAITFDALLADARTRRWTTRPPTTSLEEMYATADEYPGPNDTEWLNSAVNTSEITYDQYRQLWDAVRQSMVAKGRATE
jgi:hypothetical protein